MQFYPNRQAGNFMPPLVREITQSRFQSRSGNNSNEIATAQGNHKNLFITMPKILLIEDDPIIQRVNTLFLEQLGTKVELAKDGTQALSLFPQDYDLIFLDIGLPDLSGIEVVQRMRAYEQRHRLKPNIIIALTAHGKSMKEDCLAAGFDDFYTKPLLIEELTKALKCWLPHV